jgi:hypothetical protein
MVASPRPCALARRHGSSVAPGRASIALAQAIAADDDDGVHVHNAVGAARRPARTRLALTAAGIVFAAVACSGAEVGDVIDALREARSLPAASPRSRQTREEGKMRLTSSAFDQGEAIPRRFTCDGPDVSPPLALADVPDGTVSLVLIMDDPDAPGGTWDHWVAYDIPVRTVFNADSGSVGIAGRNSWGRTGYGGPCPPRGTHRYVFTAYALDTRLGFGPGADKARVLEALDGHVLAEARLMGRYERTRD